MTCSTRLILLLVLACGCGESGSGFSITEDMAPDLQYVYRDSLTSGRYQLYLSVQFDPSSGAMAGIFSGGYAALHAFSGSVSDATSFRITTDYVDSSGDGNPLDEPGTPVVGLGTFKKDGKRLDVDYDGSNVSVRFSGGYWNSHPPS